MPNKEETIIPKDITNTRIKRKGSRNINISNIDLADYLKEELFLNIV